MDATLANELTMLREMVSTLQGTVQAVQAEDKLLRQRLARFLQRYFGGTKSESLAPKQLGLLLAGLEALSAPALVAEKPAPTRAVRTVRRARQPLPVHPETERVVLETVEVQQQPEGWRKLGEEITEELDWKPA